MTGPINDLQVSLSRQLPTSISVALKNFGSDVRLVVAHSRHNGSGRRIVVSATEYEEEASGRIVYLCLLSHFGDSDAAKNADGKRMGTEDYVQVIVAQWLLDWVEWQALSLPASAKISLAKT